MSKARALVVVALCLAAPCLAAPCLSGCDAGLPFQGKLCRQRSRVPLGATSVRLLDAERSADATLVLWTADSSIGKNPLLLSVRNSVGFRTPIQLPGIWLDPRPHALSPHDVLMVVPAPRAELLDEASREPGGMDAGVPLPGEGTVRAVRIDSRCLEHKSEVLSVHPAARVALDGDGRTALAWADVASGAGVIRARVVGASGEGQSAVVAEWEAPEAELSQLVALRGGGFVAAFGPRAAGDDGVQRLQLFSSRWARGGWQPPEPHAVGVGLASLARLSDGGAALSWTRWDGTRATLHLRLSGADGAWRDALQVLASPRRIEQLQVVASRRDARVALVFRQGGSLFVRVLDDGVALGTPGEVACDCALDDAATALALDEQGGLVVVQPLPSAPAQLLRYDGVTFERVATLGEPGSEVVEAKLAAAPDGRLTALYLQHARERIMATELTLGRPGRAAPIAVR